MFPVNLVPLLLLVGVLYDSGVDAGEHLREKPSDLREIIVSVIDTFIEYSLNGDTDAQVNLHHPDAKILIDGLPPVVGVDEIRVMLELIPDRASQINCTYKEVQAMDEDANFVYVAYHVDYFNDSGDKYLAANGVNIFRNTGDGYKFYVVMFNKHSQQN